MELKKLFKKGEMVDVLVTLVDEECVILVDAPKQKPSRISVKAGVSVEGDTLVVKDVKGKPGKRIVFESSEKAERFKSLCDRVVAVYRKTVIFLFFLPPFS